MFTNNIYKYSQLAPMSDVTTIDINHIYRDSKFSQKSFFLEK